MAAKRKSLEVELVDDKQQLQDDELNELLKYKTIILDFIEEINDHFMLIAIVISNCNGRYPYSFTGAYVEYSNSLDYVYYKSLFQIEILKHVIEKGMLPDDLESNKRILVLGALRFLSKYFAELDHNKEVLEKTSIQESTSEWSSILTAHLFKKLSPAKNVILSDDGYTRYLTCPCCCGTDLQFGDTSLGNNHVWHGSVDIICNGVIVELEEPAPDSDDSNSRVEVKNDSRTSHEQQILAESIVASFALKRPAPFINITRKDVQLYIYIPESDVLLEGAPVSLIRRGELMIKGVLLIWLILNFNGFKEDLSETIDCERMQASNFKTLVGDKLELYETSVTLHGVKRKISNDTQAQDLFDLLRQKKDMGLMNYCSKK